MTNCEILRRIDSFFFKQYKKNKLDCGYFSNCQNFQILTISDDAGNYIKFQITDKKLFIFNSNSEFDIARDLLEKELENLENFTLLRFYSNLAGASQFFGEMNELNKEPQQHKVVLADLPVKTIKALELAPIKDFCTYYYDIALKSWAFIGDFYAPSKNKARKASRIDRSLANTRRNLCF